MRLTLCEASLLGLLLPLAACGGSDDGAPTSGNLSGSVLNAPNPVSGVKVTLHGPGGTYETTTSSDGTYDLTGIPSGTYVVDLCGQGVFDADGNPIPDKINLHLPRITVGEGTAAITGKPIFLPEKAGGETVSTGGTLTGVIPAGTIIENVGAGVSVVFDELTTVTFPDTIDTTISITQVPVEQIPVALPANISAASIVAIEPAGATFDIRPRVTFNNDTSLPVGTNEVPLYRLNYATATWTQFGTGTVTADGASVISDVGQGLEATGWHGVMVQTFCTTTITGVVENAGGGSVEGALVTAINGRTTVTDQNGEFTLVEVPLPEDGFGIVVTVLPTPDTGLLPDESASMTGLCGTSTDMGTIVLGSTTIDMAPPTITASVPADGAEDISDSDSVRVTFDGAMSPSSLNSDTVSLKADGTIVSGSIGIETALSITTLTFLPDSLLPLGAECVMLIRSGARDASGNELGEDATITFTTTETTDGGAAAITIQPGTAVDIMAGDTDQLAAVVLDAGGSVVDGALVTWTSADTQILSVNSLGLVTGVGPGYTTIQVSFGDLVDSVPARIFTATVDEVVLAGGIPSITVGAGFALRAEAQDSSDGPIHGLGFDWTSSDEAVATVDAGGNVVGVAAGGPVTITATEPDSNQNANFAVTVLDPATVSLVSVTSPVTMLGDNAAAQLSARAFAGKSEMTGITFDWASSNSSVAQVNANGLVTGVAPGTVQITATADGSSSVSDTVEISVFQNTPLIVTVNGGDTGAIPQQELTIMRFDTISGDFLGEMETNSAGVADFGLTSTPRVTLACFWSDDRNSLDRALGVIDAAVGTIALTVPTTTSSANFGVSGTVPVGTTSVALDGGFHTAGERYTDPSPSSSFFLNSVEELELQSDGLLSWVATGYGSGQSGPEILSGGFLLDQSPIQFQLGLGRQVNLDAQNVTTAAFASEGAVTHVSSAFRRSGVIFNQQAAEQPPALSGTLTAVVPPGADRFMYSFSSEYAVRSLAAQVERTFVSSTQPSSFNVTVPSLDVTSFDIDPFYDNIQWFTAGNDAADLDIGFLRVLWEPKGPRAIQWDLIFDGTSTSITLPTLPGSVDHFELPQTNFSYDLKLVGSDAVSGYDAMLSALRPHGGRITNYLMQAGGISESASVGATEVELSAANNGVNGSVTIDRGNGAEAWTNGQILDVEPGQSVLVTAAAVNGAEVSAMTTSNGVVTGVGTSQATVSFDADTPVYIFVAFQPLP